MKLNPELRAAVKAAVSHQKKRESHYAIMDRQAQEWLKTPAAKKVNRLLRKYKKLSGQSHAVSQELNECGFNSQGRVWDPEAFYKTAKLPAPEAPESFTEMQVLAELSQAKPDQAATILAKYGINWE